MKLKSKKKKGFTLSEIVITLALSVALIMGISSMVMSGMRINSDSGQKQSGSQYAQQILEKFISQDIQKSLTGDMRNGYTLKLGNITLDGNNKNEFFVSDYDLDNFNISDTENIAKGYKADITIKRNSSGIGTGVQDISSEATNNDYTLYISGKGNNASLDSEKNSSLGGEALTLNDNELGIVVNIEKDSSGKTITVNNTLTKSFTEDDSIRLNLDFSNYDINNNDLTFKITVNNKDTKALNLCLQGAGSLNTEKYVNVETKKGKVLIYDNRSSGDSSSTANGDLYDISIKVKNSKDVVYEKTISRNLSISDNSN